MLLLSADLCLGFTAVKLGILPDFFHTQYEHKLIDHLSPLTNLLPIYTRRTSQCLWRELISKTPFNATFVAHSISCNSFVERLVCVGLSGLSYVSSQIKEGSLSNSWQLSRFEQGGLPKFYLRLSVDTLASF